MDSKYGQILMFTLFNLMIAAIFLSMYTAGVLGVEGVEVATAWLLVFAMVIFQVFEIFVFRTDDDDEPWAQVVLRYLSSWVLPVLLIIIF